MAQFTVTIDKIFMDGEWQDREIFMQEDFDNVSDAIDFSHTESNYPVIDCIGYAIRITDNDVEIATEEHIYGK